jgi:hypothetical protein
MEDTTAGLTIKIAAATPAITIEETTTTGTATEPISTVATGDNLQAS